jgi:hypothetical protein
VGLRNMLNCSGLIEAPTLRHTVFNHTGGAFCLNASKIPSFVR